MTKRSHDPPQGPAVDPSGDLAAQLDAFTRSLGEVGPDRWDDRAIAAGHALASKVNVLISGALVARRGRPLDFPQPSPRRPRGAGPPVS